MTTVSAAESERERAKSCRTTPPALTLTVATRSGNPVKKTFSRTERGGMSARRYSPASFVKASTPSPAVSSLPLAPRDFWSPRFPESFSDY